MSIVWLIDDQIVGAARVAEALRAAAWEVVHLCDARTASTELLSGRPDAIVVDAIAPELDGLRTVKIVREAGFDGRIVVVADGFSPIAREALSDWGAVASDVENLSLALRLPAVGVS